MDSLGGWDKITGVPEVDLQILRHQGSAYLAYRVQVSQFETGDATMPVMFIDARTGELVWR